MTRVALVDDDIEFLDELAEYLSARGFRVAVCHRPTLAWRFVRRERPEAVLLDFDMPGVSGLQILERLRESSETSAIPVLLLTAHDHPRVRSGGWSKRLDDFIPKRTERAEIELRLNRAVERFREREAYASTSGLPSGSGAGAAFSRALADGFLQTSGEESVFVLQLPDFDLLAASDRADLYEIYRAIYTRLAHRVRDGLRPFKVGREISPGGHAVAGWEESAGRIFYYCSGRTSAVGAGRSWDAVRRVVRRVAAANRLLVSLSACDPWYLAPRGQRLVRLRLPAFQLHELRFHGRAELSSGTLLEGAREALAAGEDPQPYRLHML